MPKHNTVTYLMNNEGRVVHQWKSSYEPGQSAYLLPNGHLVRAGMLRVQGGTGGGEGGRLEEYDWDGNLVWEFNHATRDYQLHHDFKPMPNGHILALMVERKSREEASIASLTKTNGYTTLQSHLADFNPKNPASRLALTSIVARNNSVRLTWIGGSNAWQYLECSSNLASNQFHVLFPIILTAPGA